MDKYRVSAVTEYTYGNTTYIVTASCSPTATETAEQKLKRLILSHVSELYSTDNQLAMCGEPC